MCVRGAVLSEGGNASPFFDTAGGLPPQQQHLCRGLQRLLPAWLQHQEGFLLGCEPVQQPGPVLGDPAVHLPMRVRALRHPARELQVAPQGPALL